MNSLISHKNMLDPEINSLIDEFISSNKNVIICSSPEHCQYYYFKKSAHRWISLYNKYKIKEFFSNNLAEKFNELDTKEQRIVFEKIKHCLYDPDLINKLNSNVVCFNNGVYDIRQQTFRDGLPSDYNTFCVGYDYKEYNENKPEITKINKFFNNVCSDKEAKDYMLNLMAHMLTSSQKNTCK